MKMHVIFSFLFLLSVMGSIDCMYQPVPGSLLFILDDKKQMIEYGSRNMEFSFRPSEFVGKKITTMAPLNEADRIAIKNALNEALVTNKRIRVPFQDKILVALIQYKQKKGQFKVIITKDNN